MSDASQANNNFAKALKSIRKSKDLSQEDFSLTSSRTYVSALERNMKSPTLNKVDDLAEVLGVHPLTLLALSYLQTTESESINKILKLVSDEMSELK